MELRSIDADALAAWCRTQFDATPTAVLFEVCHLSAVVGLHLSDGREVVVKARPPAQRIAACVEVQRRLSVAGFPCPRPLAGPVELDGRIATAEVFVPGGTIAESVSDAPRRFAEPLARLVQLAPPVETLSTLKPSPPWVGWDHGLPGLWPPPDDRDADLNAHPEPSWLDDLARRVRRSLATLRRPCVIGHGDWESQNLRWNDGRLHVVHDWDSVLSQPEAAVAGAAAAVFPAAGAPRAATVDESEAFLAAYERARGRPWAEDEARAAWAAGLWVVAFNAKKESLDGGGPLTEQLALERDERLRRAGA